MNTITLTDLEIDGGFLKKNGIPLTQTYENELSGARLDSSPFAERIVGNVIPWIGESDDGTSGEEKKVISESPMDPGERDPPKTSESNDPTRPS